MTRVDFYILKDLEQHAAFRFACRLGLKGFTAGQLVHVHVKDAQQAHALDELMWDYPQHRFVPHCILDENLGERVDDNSANASDQPIHIGWQTPKFSQGLLINLTPDVPTFFGRFDRVAEIIVEQTKTSGRSRYAHYRDRGYPIHHHELEQWEN